MITAPLGPSIFDRFIAARHPDILPLPGPPTTFPLGNMADFIALQRRPWEVIDRYHAQYGRACKAWAGTMPIVFIFDPEGVEEVFVSQASRFTKQAPTTCLKPTVGTANPFNVNGAEWERNAQHSFLGATGLSAFFDEHFPALTQQVPALLAKHGLYDDAADFSRRFDGFMMDCFALVSGGEALPGPIRESFAAMGPAADASIKFNLPLPTLPFLSGRRRWLDYWSAQVDRASKAAGASARSIADRFVRESKLDRPDFAWELGNNFWGGVFSTQATLANTLFHLAKHSKVSDRLREEVRGANLTYQDLRANVFIDAVIRESLRVTPPVPVYGRTLVAEGTRVMGMNLPKGTTLLFSCRPLHFRESVWASPRSFDPQRWTADVMQEHRYGSRWFMPFGVGARSCIGQAFALYLIRSVLYAIYREAVPRFANAEQSFRFFFGTQIPDKLRGGLMKC